MACKLLICTRRFNVLNCQKGVKMLSTKQRIILNALQDEELYIKFYFNNNNLRVLVNGSLSKGTRSEHLDKIWNNYLKDSREFARLVAKENKTLKRKNENEHKKKNSTKEETESDENTLFLLPPVKTTFFNFQKMYSQFLLDSRTAALDELREAMRFDKKASDSALKEWLGAIKKDFTELDLVVMKQWIWLVKRAVFGKTKSYHLAPVLVGAQGSGKTEAIKKLTEPLERLTVTWNITDLVDERNTKTLSENFIVFADEFAGAAFLDVAKLKRVITASELSYRPLYSNDSEKVLQNCTLIAAANKSLKELVRDSEMRRFYQINCTNMDWNKINSTDSINIWKAIDENVDYGYTREHAEALSKYQLTATTSNSVEEFVQEFNLTNAPDGYRPVDSRKVWGAFVRFCGGSQDYQGKDLIQFKSALASCGVNEEYVLNGKGGKTSCLLIPKGNALLKQIEEDDNIISIKKEA